MTPIEPDSSQPRLSDAADATHVAGPSNVADPSHAAEPSYAADRNHVAASNQIAEANADLVRRLFASYLAQDRDTAEQLIAPQFAFTSPQDDHLDRETYFNVCFPTASRLRRQQIQRLACTGDDVFVMYEYELLDGAIHRNAELLTIRQAQVTEVQVFFGGRYSTPAHPPT